MSFNKLKIVSLFLVLFITGCTKKDELTRPVKVYFKIGISTDSTVIAPEYFAFNECQIGIQSIQFEGKREAGGDIYFETDSKMNLPTITFREPAVISEFDVPQGIYYYMKWIITMKCMEEYTPCTGIVIKGDYFPQTGLEMPFLLEIEQPEEFSVKAYDPENRSTIVLTKNKEYQATVLIDPVNAFNAISRYDMENAEISDTGGETCIIISRIKNGDLYTILLNRIFGSAKVVIK